MSEFSQNPKLTAQNQLIQWINNAGMSEGKKKTDLLRKILEVLIHQLPQMIPVYMENILSYINDKNTEVKKQVIAFIEEVSKQQPEHLPAVVGKLRISIIDSVIAVQKRAIQAASIVYRNSLLWLCESDADIEDKEHVWEQLSALKLLVLNMIDSDNEGIRTHSIKFLEEVVLLQTAGEPTEGEFSIDRLPSSLTFIKRKALEEESEHIFTLLIKFHNSQHISSVNLMACMTTLCLISKLRPKYMPRVVQALADLHTTLPPTLSQSQVNSVRKHLRMLLVNLIKHPSSNDMLPQLTQLLIDIGMTQQEINKAVPKDRRNKRVGEIKTADIPTKRIRIDSPQSNSQGSDSNSRSDFNYDEDSQTSLSKQPVVTEDTLFEGLDNAENVVKLVMSTLLNNLPNELPSSFVTIYKPIPNAGSKVQKRSLAKLMHNLIKGEPAPVPVPAPVPPVSETIKIPLLRDDDEKITTSSLKQAVAKLQETTKADREAEKIMEETRQDFLKEEERKNKEKEKAIPPQTPTVPRLKQKVKLLKLQEITRPIPKEIKEKLILQAIGRILNAEKEAAIGGAANIRAKLITIFASSYTPEIRELVLNYILEDPASRIDLALSWLYEEFAFMQGFSRHPVTLQPKMHEKHDQNYNQLLCALITQVCERGEVPATEGSKDMLLRKIYLEAPLVTQESVDYLKHLVSENNLAALALEILEELCLYRAPRAHKYVAALVCNVMNENEEIRDQALNATLKIYANSTEAVKRVVEKHARLYLGFIVMPNPPSEFAADQARHGVRPVWTDELYKTCLNLAMSLFMDNEEIRYYKMIIRRNNAYYETFCEKKGYRTDDLCKTCLNLAILLFMDNEDLMIEVGRVYGGAPAEAKRAVLRCAEAPARAAAADNRREAFLALLDDCPRGADTLLTRLLHIFTDKSPPTQELVSRVRALYATRVSDVRFLIPVLNGLSKKEIVAALPKLIKLNPMVVKEVFNKLLGLQNPNDEILPVSPAELLIALHLIDPGVVDLKYIIKATALCFAEKQIFTQEVLAIVLQQLIEEPDIPVLLMRTVLQALTLHPALKPLVLNILQLLIEKEVWNNKVAWEGWVKCCERTLPGSSAVLRALPPAPAALAAQVPALRAAMPDQQFAPVPPPASHLGIPLGNPLEPLPPGME